MGFTIPEKKSVPENPNCLLPPMMTVTITSLRRNDNDQKSVMMMMTHRRKKVARAMPPSSATRVYGSNTGGQQWPYPSEAEPNRPDSCLAETRSVMLGHTEQQTCKMRCLTLYRMARIIICPLHFYFLHVESLY